MPSVPRANPSDVGSLKPLPDARVTGGATAETFGGGASAKEVGTALGGFNDAAMKLLIQEKKNADDIRVQDADTNTAMFFNDLQNKSTELRGADSTLVAPKGNESADQHYSDVIKSLSNDTQRVDYTKKYQLRKVRFNDWANGYSATEVRKHEDESFKSALDVSQVSASNDPSKVPTEISLQDSIIRDRNAKLGIHDEAITKAQIQDSHTKTYAGVIDRFLTNNDIASAESFFKAHKDEMDPRVANTYKGHLAQESNRIATEQSVQLKAAYEDGDTQTQEDWYNGALSVGELKRRWENGLPPDRRIQLGLSPSPTEGSVMLSQADHDKWEKKLSDPIYKTARTAAGLEADDQKASHHTDYEKFNEIRQAQLDGTRTVREIKDMTAAAADAGVLLPKDASYLSTQNKSLERTPRNQQISAQMNAIRNWAEKGLPYGSFLGLPIRTGGIKAAHKQGVESLVTDFERRVYTEKATGPRIDEIAQEMMGGVTKQRYPGLNNKDAHEAVLTADRKLKSILPTGSTASLQRPVYKVTITPVEPKKPKDQNK